MSCDIDKAHSPTFPSLHLHRSSFSNPFRCFTYIRAHSSTLPLLHLHDSSYSNPSFASPTSEALHLIHLASHPWCRFKLSTVRGFQVFKIQSTSKITSPRSYKMNVASVLTRDMTFVVKSNTRRGKKCNTFKEKFIVLQIDLTGSLSLQEYMIINSDQMKHNYISQ